MKNIYYKLIIINELSIVVYVFGVVIVVLHQVNSCSGIS